MAQEIRTWLLSFSSLTDIVLSERQKIFPRRGRGREGWAGLGWLATFG
jgi:hypothetical protein